MLIGQPRKTKTEEDGTVKVVSREEGLPTIFYSVGKGLQNP